MDKRKEANLHVKTSIINALIDLMKEKSFDAISFPKSRPRRGFPAFLTIGISTAKRISLSGVLTI